MGCPLGGITIWFDTICLDTICFNTIVPSTIALSTITLEPFWIERGSGAVEALALTQGLDLSIDRHPQASRYAPGLSNDKDGFGQPGAIPPFQRGQLLLAHMETTRQLRHVKALGLARLAQQLPQSHQCGNRRQLHNAVALRGYPRIRFARKGVARDLSRLGTIAQGRIHRHGVNCAVDRGQRRCACAIWVETGSLKCNGQSIDLQTNSVLLEQSKSRTVDLPISAIQSQRHPPKTIASPTNPNQAVPDRAAPNRAAPNQAVPNQAVPAQTSSPKQLAETRPIQSESLPRNSTPIN